MTVKTDAIRAGAGVRLDLWIDVELTKRILGSGSTASVRKMGKYEGRFDGPWGKGWRQRPNRQIQYYAAGVLAYAGRDASEFPELLDGPGAAAA